MSGTAGDVPVYRGFFGTPDTFRLKAIVDIGSTGAPTVTYSHGTWTVTRTGTGTYTGTMPIAGAQSTSMATLNGRVTLSAAKTVGNVIMTAVSHTAGTFGFTTAISAGTAADPASGDQLELTLECGTAQVR